MGQEQRASPDSPRSATLFGVQFDLLTSIELRTWVRGVLAGPVETRHIAFSNSEFLLEAGKTSGSVGT